MRRLAWLVAAGLLACRPASDRSAGGTPDLASIRTQLAGFWQRYDATCRARNLDAFAALHTDSVRLDYSEFPPIRGYAANREFVDGLMKAASCDSLAFEGQEVLLYAPGVVQLGRYAETVTPTGQPRQTDFGRFTAVFVLDSSGQYRLARLMGLKDSTVTHR